LSLKIKYNEEELVALIRNRNQRAFGYLYDNYSKALYVVIYAILNDTSDSEDVLQKTFLKIWDNFSSYDASKGRLYTWMLNIARNQAIDSTRSKHSKMKTKIQNNADNVNLLDRKLGGYEGEYNFIGFKNILRDLSEEHQLVIQMAYYEGYSQEEISKKLNMPLGTVKTKVRQAILTLRKLTQKEHLQ
jgi:RNA polymerase sigma-70 factor, ECF subfamily